MTAMAKSLWLPPRPRLSRWSGQGGGSWSTSRNRKWSDRGGGGGGSAFSNTYSYLTDGTTERGTLTTNIPVQNNEAMSVAFWAKAQSTESGYGMILTCGKTGDVGWTIGFLNSKLDFLMYDGTSSARVQSSSNYTLHEWNHWVVVKTTSNNVTDWKIYLNGSDNTGTTTGTTVGTINFTSTVSECFHSAVRGYGYQGYADEMAFWYGTALSAAQVTSLYNGGDYQDLSLVSPTPTAAWAFGGGGDTYTTINDLIGSNDISMSNTESTDLCLHTKDAWSSRSISFNGSDEYLTIGDTSMNSLFTHNAAVSVGFWILGKPTSADLLANVDAGVRGLEIYLNASGNPVWYIGDTYPANYIERVWTSGASSTLWNYYLLCFDGSNDPTAMKCYINGSAATVSSTTNNGTRSNTTSTSNLQFGKFPNFGAGYLSTNIDELAIWTSDQSANQATIYGAAITQDLSLLAAPPNYYWPFETDYTASLGSKNWTATNMDSTNFARSTP